MKTKQTIFALGLIASGLTLFGAQTQADEGPQFHCTDKVVVEYHPGPKWLDLGKHLESHLAFIAEQLKAGVVAEAGPLYAPEGHPSGGMMIYNKSDFETVVQIASQDPLVREKVSNFSLRTWRKCELEN